MDCDSFLERFPSLAVPGCRSHHIMDRPARVNFPVVGYAVILAAKLVPKLDAPTSELLMQSVRLQRW